jgi:hypothetical protein
MANEPVKGADALALTDIKNILYAAEMHNYPVYPAKGPCGGCDLVIKPKIQGKGPCGACDVIKPPKLQGKGPCGGCDILK